MKIDDELSQIKVIIITMTKRCYVDVKHSQEKREKCRLADKIIRRRGRRMRKQRKGERESEKNCQGEERKGIMMRIANIIVNMKRN